MPTSLPSQIEIMAAILRAFPKGFMADARLLNTITRCATEISVAARREKVVAKPGSGLSAWLNADDQGASSRYLASVLSGTFSEEFNHPWDADDFGRCYRLLRVAPELKENFAKLASLKAPWPELYSNWDELEMLYQGAVSGTDDSSAHALAFRTKLNKCIGR